MCQWKRKDSCFRGAHSQAQIGFFFLLSLITFSWCMHSPLLPSLPMPAAITRGHAMPSMQLLCCWTLRAGWCRGVVLLLQRLQEISGMPAISVTYTSSTRVTKNLLWKPNITVSWRPVTEFEQHWMQSVHRKKKTNKPTNKQTSNNKKTSSSF